MLSPRLRPYAWMLLVAALLLAAFSVTVVAAVASLSGAPHYAGDARREAIKWEAAFGASVLLAAASTYVIVATHRPRV